MDSSSPFELRPAVSSDCRRIWEINGHPSVRAQAIHTEPIAWDDHLAWFSRSLSSPSRHIDVVDVEAQVVGVVRLDVDARNRETVISIALDPAHRGRGVGRAVIAEASRRALSRGNADVVAALIRPSNTASLSAFQAAGFAPVGRVEISGVSLCRLLLSGGQAESTD